MTTFHSSRRGFLQSSAATTAAATTHTLLPTAVGNERATEPRRTGKPRIAIITTVWAFLDHGQHIGDRFLVGYPWEGDWQEPRVEVVSAYVDQVPNATRRAERERQYGFPQGDQSAGRAREFGFTLYKTIASALRRGGRRLDVDGVVVIGEQGDYPSNVHGQKLYPRADFFQQITDVFRTDDRSVPVFNDKHLSYSFSKALGMVEASRELDFPMLAGSSLPVGWRMPEMEIPHGAEIEEALVICPSDALDSAGFHALEALQCLVERRDGGERGIRRVTTLVGQAAWNAMAEGRWSHELMSRALSRADVIKGQTLVDARTQDLAAPGTLEEIVPHPQAVLIEYRDGLRATMLLLDGAVGDFTAAVQLDRDDRILSTKFHLPPEPNVAYSACLARHIEDLVLNRRANFPIERTLLVSGLLEAAHKSRTAGGRPMKTRHLEIRYRAPRRSLYCRT